ncbi:MAG: GNAT family N-acetyltransferase [Alphaproteobacteria bacterium]|nr:GNAT family N-acetyltransferase [Alphaproteobacteria bacterium]
MTADEMATIHACAFPAGEAWDARAIAGLLATPGCFACSRPGAFILARVAADEAEVLTLATHPAARRQGLARALLDEAAAAAIACGASTMWLEVAENNSAALALYRALGFEEAGRRAGYYANNTAALVLKLNLS